MSASEKTKYTEVSKDPESSRGARKKKHHKTVIFLFAFCLVLTILCVAILALAKTIFHDTPRAPCQRRIVGYFDLIHDELEYTSKQISNLTHLIIAPVEIEPDGDLSFRNYRERERFETIVKMARKVPDLKVIFSLADVIENPSKVLKSHDNREILLAKISDFIADQNIDGVDVNWKWTRTDEDYEVLVSFFKDLKDKLARLSDSFGRKAPYSLSILLPAHIPSTKVSELMDLVDFVTITTHNYYGSWQTNLPYLLGPASPLYSKLGKLPNENVDSSMKEYTCFTKHPNKLNILVEFMGRYWKHLEMPLNGEVRSDWIEWRKMGESEWDVKDASWNDDSKTPYIWDPYEKKYMAFENERSLEEKIKYGIEKNIGGLAVWRFDHDDSKNTLLSVVSRANLCSGSDNTAVKYNC